MVAKESILRTKLGNLVNNHIFLRVSTAADIIKRSNLKLSVK